MSPGFALRIVSIAERRAARPAVGQALGDDDLGRDRLDQLAQPLEVGRLADDAHVELGVDRCPEPRVHEREVEDREQHAELVAAGGGSVTGHWYLSWRGTPWIRV